LFITDGYNFRNHEFGAVLGISQLNRLDNMISIRKRNYKRFTEILLKYPELFYQMKYDETNSSFCLPFICKNKSIMIKMKEIFTKFGIEYRPVVSGNLLRQPFLKNYSLDNDKKISTADIINDQGVYIGNNHFITDKDMDFLESILENMNE
jgi:CDP-4-dehydro-6-deoxyglucose reductase, E1